MEDFDESNDPEFIKDILEPYLEDLYKDLRLRVQKGKTGLTKNVFRDYLELPEVVANQLFEIIISGSEDITLHQFQEFIITIFVSPLNDRIAFTFKLYDFNKDSKICKDDVKLLLAYSNLSTMIAEERAKANQLSANEGKLKNNKYLSFFSRVSQKKEIDAFVDEVFGRN